MTSFLVTLLVFIVAGLLMGVGLLLGGRPLSRGCGRNLPDVLRCAACPYRWRHDAANCPNRGDD